MNFARIYLFFARLLTLTLSLGIVLGPSQKSYADANAAAVGSIVSSSVMMLQGGKELAKDLAAPNPSGIAITIDILTIVGGAALLAVSLTAKDQTDGDNIAPPLPGSDPFTKKNQPPGLCADNNPICDCTGPDSATNPVCNPEFVAKGVEIIKTGLKNGDFVPPDGETPEKLTEKLDSLLGDLNLINGVVAGGQPESSLAELSGVRGSGFGSAGRTGLSRAGKDAFNENTQVSGSNFGSFGSSSSGSNVAGPADRTGLGKTIFDGLLNIINADSGEDLSIFQRNTRRHQGDNGTRSFMMARIEQIRQSALKYRDKLSAPAKLAKSSPTQKPRKPATSPRQAPKGAKKSQKTPKSALSTPK
jgi:hypothetical protein